MLIFSFSQNVFFLNKVCITNVLWERGKQRDRENNMEERKRGKWQRTKWGRNREGRGREREGEREQMIARNERGIEGEGGEEIKTTATGGG